MFSLKSKTCTKISRNFLIGSFFFVILMVVNWFSQIHGFYPFRNLSTVGLAVIYYLCCLLSGLSLIFSTGAHSKALKKWATFVHFGYVYWIVLFFIGFVGIQRYDFFIALVAYLLLSIWLLKKIQTIRKR